MSSAEQRLHEEQMGLTVQELSQARKRKNSRVHVLRDQRSDGLKKRDTLPPVLPWDASLKYHTLLL